MEFVIVLLTYERTVEPKSAKRKSENCGKRFIAEGIWFVQIEEVCFVFIVFMHSMTIYIYLGCQRND